MCLFYRRLDGAAAPARGSAQAGECAARGPANLNKTRASRIELAEQSPRINAFSYRAVRIGPHWVRPRSPARRTVLSLAGSPVAQCHLAAPPSVIQAPDKHLKERVMDAQIIAFLILLPITLVFVYAGIHEFRR